jgi:transcriptional regulator with XRE-family HTH domain
MPAWDVTESAARSALGAGLRNARADRGLSQGGLEAWSGVDQTTISRIENGAPMGLRFATYVKLLDALGATDVAITVPRRLPPL